MPSFSQFWANHPTIKGDAPLLDKKAYPNQCAINLYAALQRSGFNVGTFHGQMSWQNDRPKYAIRAQELANWLARIASTPSRVEKFSGKDFSEKVSSRRGIIFFQNYWGTGHQGDHIDLWNGSRLTDWTSWIRIQCHLSIEGLWSDFRQSEAVWFWQIS